VPDAPDKELILTRLALSIDRTGALLDVDFLGQSGVNDNNRSIADRHKECAMRAARLASPYKLDPEDYEVWKRWPMNFRLKP
jgi:hypothetical protein